MIDAILGRVTGFLERDFLFASFLPALLLMLAAGGTVLGVTGVPPWLAVMDGWSAGRLSLALFAALVVVTVLAYVLVSLRPAMVGLWSGTSPVWQFTPGVIALAVAQHRKTFRALTAASLATPAWRSAAHHFPERALPDWFPVGVTLVPPNTAEWQTLDRVVASARSATTPEAFWEAVEPFFDQLKRSGGEVLEPIYTALVRILSEQEQLETSRSQANEVALDRRFGSFSTIRPTALGNVITSYQEYPFKRYGMEAEVFWPRLRAVIPQSFFELVQEPRILLDFAVTMASLFVAFGLAAALLGPWLTFRPAAWIAITLACAAMSYLFYRVAVSAADRFGEFVRACFDLYRLDLMTSLRRPLPVTTSAERAQWQELSQIAVYGSTGHDVVLAHPVATPSVSG